MFLRSIEDRGIASAPYGRSGLGTPNHHPHPQASKRLPFRQSLALACVQFATWGEAPSLSDLSGIGLFHDCHRAVYPIRKRRSLESKTGVEMLLHLDLRSFDKRHVSTLTATVGGAFVLCRQLFQIPLVSTHCVYPCGHAIMEAWLTHRRAEPMTPTEAADLVELSASIWGNIKNTPRTCEAWFLALAHTNFYDAKDAIGELARVRKTVHVSDVVKRANYVRDRLLRSLPPIPTPPVELADDPAAETHWMRVARERQLSQARMERHAVPA